MLTIPDINLENVGSRLKKVRETQKMTLNAFYAPISKYVSNFSAIENGKRPIGRKTIHQIMQLYHINPSYLETGAGEMFLSPWPFEEREIEQSETRVPYYNISMAQLAENDSVLAHERPDYYVDFRPFNDCDAWLPVYGDSMYPKYASGEMIAVKEITNLDILQWGEAYLVMGDDRANSMVTIKLIFPHADADKLVLRSANPAFEGDTVLHKTYIRKLYIIKGKITRNQL